MSYSLKMQFYFVPLDTLEARYHGQYKFEYIYIYIILWEKLCSVHTF